MQWLYLHFPSLQLDVLQLQHPQQPLALADPAKHQIMALNQAAKLRGVALSQSVATAVLLCPDLQVYPPNVQQQQQLLLQLCEQLYQYTAEIMLQPPDGLAIRVSAMLQLYHDFSAYWQQLHQVLQVNKQHYIAACADTLLGARLLAKSGQTWLQPNSNSTAQKLAETPLCYSELSLVHQQQLARLGITCLGPLLTLAPAELGRRFPAEVNYYLQQLQGKQVSPPQFYRPARQFKRYLLLSYEISQSDLLLLPLRAFLVELQQFLQQANQLCRSILLTLHFRQATALPLTVQAVGGETQAGRWEELLRLQLANLNLPEPVYALDLHALHLDAAVTESGSMLQQRPGALSVPQLLSLLSAKLGEQALHSPAFIDSHWPEHTIQRQAPLNMSASSAVAASGTAYVARPSLQLALPIPLTEQVQVLGSAERLESLCWHSGERLQRDYYVARNQQGQQLWVFRTPEQKWYLHGWFS